MARVKIEQRLADRTLSDAQVRAIANQLRPFAGQEFDMMWREDLRESSMLAGQIRVALDLAQWQYARLPRLIMTITGGEGLQLCVNPLAEEKTKKAAGLLLSLLNGEGVATQLTNHCLEAQREGDGSAPKHNKIQIFVGAKP